MFWKPAQPMEPRAPRPRALHPKRRPPAPSAASSAHIDSAHTDYVGANAFVGPASEASISSAPIPAKTTRQLNSSIIGSLLPSFLNDLSVMDLSIVETKCLPRLSARSTSGFPTGAVYHYGLDAFPILKEDSPLRHQNQPPEGSRPLRRRY